MRKTLDLRGMLALSTLLALAALSALPAKTAGGEPLNERLLTPEDPHVGTNFGRWVAIDGETIVVGAPFHTASDSKGAAYVFEKDAGGPETWGQTALLRDPSIDNGSHLGVPVVIVGDLVAASAIRDDEPSFDGGSVYLWDRNEGGPGAWGFVAKLTASDATSFDLFGSGLGFDGDTLVSGAPGSTPDDSGAAYVFSRDPATRGSRSPR